MIDVDNLDPDYYRRRGLRCAGCGSEVETFNVITGWGLDWALGHVVKYVSRAGLKAGAPAASDLRKARWFLDRAIAAAEGDAGAE